MRKWGSTEGNELPASQNSDCGTEMQTPVPVLITTMGIDAQTVANPDSEDEVGISRYQVHRTPPCFILIRLAARKESKALRFI